MNKKKQQQRQKVQKFVVHASDVCNRVWFACAANQIQISNKIETEKGRDREKIHSYVYVLHESDGSQSVGYTL